MLKKTLIVGTTPDYIQWIRQSCPDQALFLTWPDLRQAAGEECPAPHEEILCSPNRPDQVLAALKTHLKVWNLSIDSIFCFDCESMALTAAIAGRFNLDYPSARAIQNCRDKYVSKMIWQQHRINCPRVALIRSASDAVSFFKTLESGCVLKPIAGGGSELVFKCTSPADCCSAFKTIYQGLQIRKANPLFHQSCSKDALMLAEERIVGTEYSCDFIVEKGRVHIIRLAKKITTPFKPFGTILGYVLPAGLPGGITDSQLHRLLLDSSTALGIQRGLCMVDFMVEGGKIMMIELTPRPGGDCLPHLLKARTRMDMLKLSLDFARHKLPALQPVTPGKPFIGIRLHAGHEGVLKKIEDGPVRQDPRVKQILVTKKPGHIIKLPPEDYDSWNLGHIIVEPSTEKFPESQALAIARQINIVIEPALEERIKSHA